MLATNINQLLMHWKKSYQKNQQMGAYDYKILAENKTKIIMQIC